MSDAPVDYKALYEAEQKAKEEALRREEAALLREEAALLREEQERREREEAEQRAEQLHEELYGTVDEILNCPLLPFLPTEGSNKKSTTGKRAIRNVPWTIREWENFPGYARSFLARFGDISVHKSRETETTPEYCEAGVSGNFSTLFMQMTLLFNELGFIAKGALSTFDRSKPQGGFPDCVIKAYGDLIILGELKNPRVELRSEMAPFHQELLGQNEFQKTTIQLYNYLISNNGAIYGFISNWTDWVFFRRLRGPSGEEILEMSRYFSRQEARKHLAAFLYLAMRHSSRLGKLSSANLPLDYGPGGGRDNLDPDDDDDDDPRRRGEPLRLPFFEFQLPAGNSRAQGVNQDDMEGFFSLATQVAGVPFTTTTSFLGIDNLSVSMVNKSEVLLHTTKSATFRYRSEDQDIVWRLIDIYGLPKNNKDFALPELQAMITAEIQTYMHLREHQGKLIPRFKYFGHDFGSFWVFVTSYEGVSLSKIVEEKGGLSQAIKTKVKVSLSELHRLGVLHGDVKLGNILLRNSQDVVWIDFEFSEIGPVSPESAQDELIRLDKELELVPTLPEPEPDTVPVSKSHTVQTPKSESSHSSAEKSRSKKKMKRTKVCCTCL